MEKLHLLNHKKQNSEKLLRIVQEIFQKNYVLLKLIIMYINVFRNHCLRAKLKIYLMILK